MPQNVAESPVDVVPSGVTGSRAAERRVEARQGALLEVARSGLLAKDFAATCQQLTETTVEALGVERASVWLLHADSGELELQDIFQRGTGKHAGGMVLRQVDYPRYFAALKSDRTISASDAATDARTSEFREGYLNPQNIVSLLDARIARGDELYGVICIESVGERRDWQPDEQLFAAWVADLAAVAYESELGRQAEVRLKASEERFACAFHLNPDSMVLVRAADNVIVEVNRHFEVQTGYGNAEVRGRNIAELKLWSHRAEMDAWNTALREYGMIRDFEATMRMRPGSERLVQISSETVTIDGEAFVLTAARDITLSRKRERVIRDLSDSMAGATGAGFFSTLVEQLARTLDADMVMVGELSPERDGYVRTVAVHAAGGAAPNFSYPLRGSPCTEVLGSGICCYPRGVADQFPEDRPLKDRGMQAYVGAPLLDSSGHALGLMAVLFKRPLDDGEGSEMTESLLRIFAIRAAAELERLIQLKELEYRASHDLLTGLPNRLRMERRIAEHLSGTPGAAAALMLIDLDRFKEINDTLGHAVGDSLLVKVARRLGQEMHTAYADNEATVARLGGDEFGIWLTNLRGPADMEIAARRALAAITAPFDISGYRLEVGASIGIARHPDHGDSATELFRRADIAMYVAKRSGAGFEFYQPSDDPYSPARLGLMSQLGSAVRANQFVLNYQPRLTMKDQRVAGFEALVRWQHPELGLLPPGQFIPLAELSDAIRPLTLWIFDAALAQQAEWRRTGHHTLVAINLSPRLLMDRSCPDQIEALLHKHGADPTLVECEVTESSLIVDPGRVGENLQRLHEMGLKIAIDDFGTGYSSLSHLKRLPLHALKIDVSFVTHMNQNEQDAAIVSSTIGLAHNLGLEVVAEGIEDEATLLRLKEMGCDEGQGYWIGRPVPAAEAARWLH